MSYERELFRLDVPHGDGDLYFAWQPGSGMYLATTGNDYSVAVFTRQGKLHERIRLPGQCTGFGWDSDGDLLGMICNGSFQVMIWDANTGKKYSIETGLKDTLSVIAWAKSESMLAVATARGNLSIYNHRTSKRIPIIGKHNKRVVTANWSSKNLLALGAEDRTLSISTSDGDTLRTLQLRGDPSAIHFFDSKHDERSTSDTILSVVVGKRILFLYNLQDPENPVELSFQSKYGSIVAYEWYGDGYILVGFSAGYLISISTSVREVGQELFQVKNHQGRLSCLATSMAINKLATCGDTQVKIHELHNLSDVSAVVSLPDEASLDKVGWSQDGQLLCVATSMGSAIVYLSKLIRIFAYCANIVAVLSSLSQVTVYMVKGKGTGSVNVTTEVEPTLVAVGPYHLVVAMNNRSWIYDLVGDSATNGGTHNLTPKPALLGDREYLSNITSLCLNAEYTSALCEGKVYLHLTESTGLSPNKDREDKEMKIFPETGEQMCITSHALTTDFLLFSSDMGDIQMFGIEDWTKLTEYRHTIGIKYVYPDATATRIIVVDERSEGFLYSPIHGTMVAIPDFPSTTTGALWELSTTNKDVFVTFDSTKVVTYIHLRHSLQGSKVERVGQTKLGVDQIPVVLDNGMLTVQTPGGKLTSLLLSTHALSSSLINAHSSQETLKSNLDKHLALHRYKDAWSTCLVLNSKESWERLATQALSHLNLDIGLKVYRHLGEPGMVTSLQALQVIEDKKLLAGSIAELLGDYDRSQLLYLESSQPTKALTMRQNLLQWEQALQLARTLAPQEIPHTALEYAKQLELTGQYAEALTHYHRAQQQEEPANSPHNVSCTEGIARTSLRIGDFTRALQIANHANSTHSLRIQCAEILESVKRYNDAALLYEKSGDVDKAAECYIGLKNWKRIGDLLSRVTKPKILQQYAKAKESDGDYASAVEAYEKAGDIESVVRLLLDKLNQPQRAVQLVQHSRNMEAAKLVAKFLEKIGDYASALRFLVVSRCEKDALKLCKEQGLVELYASIVTEELGGSEDGERHLAQLAVHFEQEGKLMLAAKCYYHAAQFSKSLRNLIQYARGKQGDDEAIALAIEVVGAANDDTLANQLIELLLGEVDGEPRDPKYVFKLYKARKQYKEAAKTAVIIANEEVVNGNYSGAHSVLVGMAIDLHDHGLPVARELLTLLTLLHSYRLVRIHVKRGDHLRAARMLLRVADSISRFPAHVVPILTSTVIECHRADLKASAFQYAVMLMRPEYKSKIEQKYLKKMEGTVRKPPRGPDNKLAADPPEPATPCPYCDYKLPESQLVCPQCSNSIPFCIASGRHIIREDFAVCPNCQFPAIKSELLLLLESAQTCPLCMGVIDLDLLHIDTDIESYLFPHREE